MILNWASAYDRNILIFYGKESITLNRKELETDLRVFIKCKMLREEGSIRHMYLILQDKVVQLQMIFCGSRSLNIDLFHSKIVIIIVRTIMIIIMLIMIVIIMITVRTIKRR